MSYIGKQPRKAALTASDIEDGIITAAKIEDGAVVAAEIASNAVTTAKINADAVTSAKIADNAVVTAAINADAVTGAKIADDAINSEHYTDGSIDTAHLADGQVTTAKLATAVFTGATDIGAAIADADLFLMDDGAGGTIRKTAASRIKTYAGGLTGVTTDSGNVTITDGNLTFGGAGHGVHLGVTSATASNLLDDYEEGTWTPSIDGTSIGAVGYYRKIGKICLVHFGNQTGAALALNDGADYDISGLPFSIIGSGWQYGSVPSASFADASASYYSQPLTGRQNNSGNIHIMNRSGVAVTSSDPVNISMVYSTN